MYVRKYPLEEQEERTLDSRWIANFLITRDVSDAGGSLMPWNCNVLATPGEHETRSNLTTDLKVGGSNAPGCATPG